MDNATIQEFLDEHDYDIRKTHNGRWIDQKCTMDVVCLVSDCIVEYTSGRNRKSFTVNDIWYNDYTVDNVQQIFSKPNPTEKASNEYDKYFGQPIKLLDAAGIIHGEKSGHGYVYSIVNQDLLEYISFRERNCYNFLCLYIEKVLRDSGIYRMFEYFFRLQDKNSFKELKDSYTSFTIRSIRKSRWICRFCQSRRCIKCRRFYYITTDRNRIGEPARRCQCPETGVQ